MGLFNRLFGGSSESSGSRSYRTKSGTTIRQSSDGKTFIHRDTTKSGGSKKTTYWYRHR